MLGLIDGHHAAFELVGQAAEIAPPLGVIVQLAAHFGQELAVVANLDFGQSLSVGYHQISKPQHHLAALGRRHLRVRPRAHRAFGCLHRPVHVLCASLGDTSPCLSGVGIDRIHPLAVERLDVLIVDEVVISLHAGLRGE